MSLVERTVGVVGGLTVAAMLVALSLYRSLVLGVDLAAVPMTATTAPTATMRPALLVMSTTVPTPAASATFIPTTTDAPQGPVAVATSAPLVHVVARGENLYRIALSYGVTLQALALVNHIGDTSQLYVGQQLLIPPVPSASVVLAQPPVVSVVTTPLAASWGSAPAEQSINAVPVRAFIVLSGDVKQNIRQIYERGLALGNNPHAFSSVGDSTIEYPYFMTRFDDPGGYNLGIYGYLQPTINYFAGSFDRESQGVMRGLRASTALDPLWSDKTYCYTNESRVACEYRVHRPSIVFIRLGSNDTQPEVFDQYLRKVVDFWIAQGVIPIMGTKADRHEGPDNADNNVIRKIAADYALPLWDFDVLAQTIPGGGVGRDGIHLTSFYSHDFTDPVAFQRGYGVHNLSALMALDSVWRALTPENDQRR